MYFWMVLCRRSLHFTHHTNQPSETTEIGKSLASDVVSNRQPSRRVATSQTERTLVSFSIHVVSINIWRWTSRALTVRSECDFVCVHCCFVLSAVWKRVLKIRVHANNEKHATLNCRFSYLSFAYTTTTTKRDDDMKLSRRATFRDITRDTTVWQPYHPPYAYTRTHIFHWRYRWKERGIFLTRMGRCWAGWSDGLWQAHHNNTVDRYIVIKVCVWVS